MMQFSTLAVAAAHAFLFLSAFYGGSNSASANVSLTTSSSKVPTKSPSYQPSSSCAWATWANVSVEVLVGEGTCLKNLVHSDGRLHSIGGIWSNLYGEVFIVDPIDNCVNKYDPSSGETHAIIGGGLPFLGLDAPFVLPQGITGSSDGQILYISDLYHIWKFNTTSGTLTRFAGALLELSASIGDGDTADIAILDHPAGIWLASNGNLYIAESGSGKVRKIDENYIISTCAGGGLIGFGGDGELADLLSVKLNLPTNVYVDHTGCVYIADSNNNRIRIVGGDGIINTFAGGGSSESCSSCAATQYSFSSIGDICGDDLGNIFVSEPGRHQILKIGSDGLIQVIVGAGHPGINLGTVPANSAITSPTSLCWDTVNCALLEVEASICVLKRTFHHQRHPTYAPTQKQVPSVPSAPSPSAPTVKQPTSPTQPTTFSPVFKPSTAKPFVSTAKPSTSLTPTSQPSSQPSSQPTDHAVCHGKHCRDRIHISGKLVLHSCACNALSSISIEIIIEALNGCSLKPQQCNVISTSPYTGASRFSRLMGFSSGIVPQTAESDNLNDFNVNFNTDYDMKYYSNQDSKSIASSKETAIRTAVESRSFQEILRHLAMIHNNSELAQVECNAVSLETTIESEDDSSSNNTHKISNGAIAGITVGCFVAGVLGFFVVFHLYNKSKENESEEVAQDDNISESPEEAAVTGEEGEGEVEGEAVVRNSEEVSPV
jgi:hypothetical protein